MAFVAVIIPLIVLFTSMHDGNLLLETQIVSKPFL